ncbi:MAG: DUF3105 domain-containing protein [Sandaracinaceae bacterium]
MGRSPLLAVFCCALGCAPSEELLDVVVTHPDAPPIPPASECTVTTARSPATDRTHVDPCSELTYPLDPPAGGTHFGVWADFGVYDEPIELGFLVHSLEHGAVALLYDCESDCPEVTDAFARIAATIDDPLCRDHPMLRRIIIAPNPGQEAPIAAVAWEHRYTATCLDEPSLAAFVTEHYAHAPENLCAPGTSTPMCP